MGIVLALDEPVAAFAGVGAPGLDGEGLVDVVVAAGLFVGFFYFGLDDVGGGEGPED